MQSVIQQAEPSPDLINQFTTEIIQAQRTALQLVIKLLHEDDTLEIFEPHPKDDARSSAAAAKATSTSIRSFQAITQRMRLQLQGALRILNMRIPGEAKRCAPKPPTSTPSQANPPSAPLLTTAGTTQCRFSDQAALSHNSSLATHTSPSAPLPSSANSVSSVVNSSARLPDRPEPFTFTDLSFIHRQRTLGIKQLPPRLYQHAKQWHDYTAATGIPSPYGLPWRQLIANGPSSEPDPPRQQDVSD